MAGAVPAAARWSARALRGAGAGAGAGERAAERAAALAGLGPLPGGAARVAEGLDWVGAVARARVPEGTPPLWAVQSRAGWGALTRAPRAGPAAPGAGTLGAEAVQRLAPRPSSGGLLSVPRPRAERSGSRPPPELTGPATVQ